MAVSSRARGNSGSSGQPSRGSSRRSDKVINRRVKTGCLTCRKRRIKCGEQKPSCANCIKSGRECDYSTRSHLDPAPDAQAALDYPFAAASSAPDLRSPPWPLAQAAPSFPSDTSASNRSSEPSMTPAISEAMPATWTQYPQAIPTTAQAMPGAWQPDTLQGLGSYDAVPTSSAVTLPAIWYGQQTHLPSLAPQQQSRQMLNAQGPTGVPGFGQPAQADPSLWAHGSFQPQYPSSSVGQHVQAMKQYDAAGSPLLRPDVSARARPGDAAAYAQRFAAASTYARPDFNQVLEMAAVEAQDDDYYDILPEEDELEDPLGFAQRRSVQAVQYGSSMGTGRPLPSYLPGMTMDFYRAENAANPLRNPATARVFSHFLNYSGPALSVFERPVGHYNPDFASHHVSEHRRTSWMYALPSLALHDNGLLHAMLALASYAMAKANDASSTPSVKHHMWSIRRVHRSLGQPGKRQEIATLASTLLLGWYEILTADHMKWSAHLAGAKQLILESHYRGMTGKILKLKAERAQRAAKPPRRDDSASPPGGGGMPAALAELDFNVVEKLIGRRLPKPEPVQRAQSSGRIRQLSAAEWTDFAIYQDIYWFFLRQDCIYSMISGNALLLPFDQWANIPPRGPVGRPEACYGSFDHLILLMGRIAEFGVRDRQRKLRAIRQQRARMARENAGQTPPGPDPSMGPRDASGRAFYGMAPAGAPAQMPSAYMGEHVPGMPQAPQPTSASREHDATAHTALAEWEEIRDSLQHFASLLGPGFRPLQEPDFSSFDTPFGRACVYPRYDIAVLWVYYFTAMIVLIRAHPTRPPAAQVAVGIAAQETAWFANEIGRITAGILPTSEPDLHPSFLGALAASMTPLFFAGVQYRQPAQRYWTVQRLCEISATCGWGTAEMCANGCETSWMRAADMGRGPPWEKVRRDFHSLDPHSSAGRVRIIPESNLDILGKPKLQKAFGIIGDATDLEFENLRL